MRIPYGRQDITDGDVQAVVDVLRSDFLTQGPCVPQFENAVAALASSEHAVAVNSATSALHIACAALGLGPSDTLWTVPNTFVASSNCALYCGAEVDFVDIDPDTFNMDVVDLESRLARADLEGKLPTVVVPVHFGGQPTEQERIWALAQRYGFKVIEDASHSIGASRNGEPSGSCRWSDITVFSFHPVKIITSGEGGMALTGSAELAERMRMLRSHGITRDADQFELSAPDHDSGGAGAPGWYYEQQLLGFNYRMTDIHAALGLQQAARVGDYVSRRNALALRYRERLSDLPLRVQKILPGNASAYHLFVVRIDPRESHADRRAVYDALRAEGIGVNLHYMPVHLQPYYRGLGFSEGRFPEAESYGRDALTIPLYPTMTEADQDAVIEALERALC